MNDAAVGGALRGNASSTPLLRLDASTPGEATGATFADKKMGPIRRSVTSPDDTIRLLLSRCKPKGTWAPWETLILELAHPPDEMATLRATREAYLCKIMKTAMADTCAINKDTIFPSILR